MISARILLVVGACVPAAAQTFVVDGSGGGNFTDLPQAIAAAPSGAALRVKPGTYSSFTVTGKSLSIIGDSAATVTVGMGSDVQVGPTALSERVVLRDLKLVPAIPPFPTVTRALRCTDARGPVLLENLVIDVTGLFPTALVVTRCSNVHVLGCDLGSVVRTNFAPGARVSIASSAVELSRTRVRGYSGLLNEGFRASHAVAAGGGSILMVVDSTLIGGDGGGVNPPRNTFAYPGGQGLALSSSAAHVYGSNSVVKGGAGGSAHFLFPQHAPAPGGDAIALTDSSARVLGFVPLAGPAGFGNPVPPTAQPVAVAGTSTFEWNPAFAQVAAAVVGTQGPGQPVALELDTVPAAWAFLALDFDLAFGLAAPLRLGGIGTGMRIVSGPFVVPVAGKVQLPVTLPSGPRDTFLFGQWFVVDPSRSELQSSNVFTLLVKS